MKIISKVVIAACFAVLLCLAGYRVYSRTVSGDVETREGIQIGALYISGTTPEKSTYHAGTPAKKPTEKQEEIARLDVVSAEVEAEETETIYAVEASRNSGLSDAENADLLDEHSENAEPENAVSGNTGISADEEAEDAPPDETYYIEANADAAEFFTGTRNFGEGVEITWNPVEGATGYRIFELTLAWDGTETDRTLIEKVEDTKYILNDIEPGKVLHLAVKPFFEDDSVKAKIKKIDVCKPGRIMTARTNRISDEKVSLKWETSPGANTYKVCRRKQNGYFEEVAEVPDTAVTIDLKPDKEYLFRVVPYYDNGFGCVRTDGSAMTAYKNVTGNVVSLDHQEYTSAECYEDIEIFNMRYSDLFETDVIGYSEDGREIVDMVVGNRSADAALLVICEIHAREYITTAMMMRIVEYYLQNYYGTLDDIKISDLLKNICIHFVVMANPDGLEISQNRTTRWKANADGINLNANFPYNFKSYGKKAEGTFTGDTAASSKEAQAIVRITRDLAGEYEKFGVLSYHAMGQIVFGSYKEEDEILAEKITEMYDIVIDSTGYKDAGSLDGGPAYGNYREYLIYVVGVPAITIEVGATVAPCDVSDYARAFEKNKYVVLREAALIAGW